MDFIYRKNTEIIVDYYAIIEIRRRINFILLVKYILQ